LSAFAILTLQLYQGGLYNFSVIRMGFLSAYLFQAGGIFLTYSLPCFYHSAQITLWWDVALFANIKTSLKNCPTIFEEY